MDPHIPRLRRKLAAIPFQPRRSHSFGEEQHEFRLGPKLAEARVAALEAGHDIVLPDAYRQFLTYIGGSGAAPFYVLIPLERCSLLVMHPRGTPGAPRGFGRTGLRTPGREFFLHVIEMGCTDIRVIAVTGPLTGRVLIGNGDGYWGPNVSSAPDFLDWYERWLNHMGAGRDNRALARTHLTQASSPPEPPPHGAEDLTLRATERLPSPLPGIESAVSAPAGPVAWRRRRPEHCPALDLRTPGTEAALSVTGASGSGSGGEDACTTCPAAGQELAGSLAWARRRSVLRVRASRRAMTGRAMPLPDRPGRRHLVHGQTGSGAASGWAGALTGGPGSRPRYCTTVFSTASARCFQRRHLSATWIASGAPSRPASA